MEYLEIPKFPVLRGDKAIEALHEIIQELEEQRGTELTDKQTDALIKVANGLISSIEGEIAPSTRNKGSQKRHFASLEKAKGSAVQRLQAYFFNQIK